MELQALNYVLDIDGDGQIAGWEAIHAIKWGFSLPGRLIIEGLGNIPLVAETLGIQASAATGYASFNSLLATVLNLLFWVILFLLITHIGAHGKTAETNAEAAETPDSPQRYRGPRVSKPPM